jgi:benzoylformate decarboxylase
VNLHTAAGLGNAGAAIMTAYHNRTPLVITAGQQGPAPDPARALSLRKLGRDGPPVREVEPPARARRGRAGLPSNAPTTRPMQAPQGPVFVSVPMNDWETEAEPVQSSRDRLPDGPQPGGPDRVARLLESSERPAIVAGAGVDRAGAFYDAVDLAERLNAPVWTDPMHPRRDFRRTIPSSGATCPSPRPLSPNNSRSTTWFSFSVPRCSGTSRTIPDLR